MFIQIGHQNQLDVSFFDSFDDFLEQLNDLFGENTFLIEKNGRKLDLTVDHSFSNDDVLKIWPKVLGGKGGFGSLLRSFGKQILISKNKEACRDLNGRRIRDVNNEKKLKEWAQKELESAATGTTESKNKSKKTEESNDYRSVAPPHKFSDSAYDEQKKQISDDMNEAVQIAAELLKKKKKSSTAVSTNDVDDDKDKDDEDVQTSIKKRRHSEDDLEDGELKTKKKNKVEKSADRAFFIGIDLDDLDSDEDDEKVSK